MRAHGITGNLFDDKAEDRIYQRAYNHVRARGYTAAEASVAGETARVNWRKGFAEEKCLELAFEHARKFRNNRQTMFPFPVPEVKL